ncbi:hypothetical protein [Aquabacterium sp. OR-4]|uniref:hypothetical protein n=1 Tax=Aquabacterium sp. OR-4 TaxID=2978127 RepID=UPI0021B42A6A|nr:hypothetical protein [Aquabacterium sp. OR-4]MDT7834284.1 hypothetical protein [Aquabacterium sp. OR-4]
MSDSLLGFHGPLADRYSHPLLAAAALRQLSRLLARLARRLESRHRSRARRASELEFYADSCAPEGALYADGELVGYLPGIRRL